MRQETAEMTSRYVVRPGFFLHRGKSVYRPGEVVSLTVRELEGYAHQVEPYPIPPDAVAARLAASTAAEDVGLREFSVRGGLCLCHNERRYESGDRLLLTPGEARQHMHAIEPIENIPPPRAAAAEDTSIKFWLVRNPFHLRRGELIHAPGAVIPMTGREALKYAHMIEPAPAGALETVGALAVQVKESLRRRRAT
jgi:hypothetical protein